MSRFLTLYMMLPVNVKVNEKKNGSAGEAEVHLQQNWPYLCGCTITFTGIILVRVVSFCLKLLKVGSVNVKDIIKMSPSSKQVGPPLPDMI